MSPRSGSSSAAADRETPGRRASLCALSAVDLALWDLRARLLGLPLASLLARRARPRRGRRERRLLLTTVDEQLGDQLTRWVAQGIPRVKMKLGREPRLDAHRLDIARAAIGDADLYVDANGAFAAKEAVHWAERYVAGWDVVWFEEPVSAEDPAGLRFVREHSSLDVAAGEYGFTLADFRALIGNVDCLQADVTRCGGITGLLRVNGLAAAHELDLSGHCAPQLSAHAFCCVDRVRHLEYLPRSRPLESMRSTACFTPVDGCLVPDRSRCGQRRLELQVDAPMRSGGPHDPALLATCAWTHATAPRRADGALRACARARGLPRAHEGLLRRQVDVDAARS